MRKWWGLLLATFLIAALAGCGSDSGDSSSSPSLGGGGAGKDPLVNATVYATSTVNATKALIAVGEIGAAGAYTFNSTLLTEFAAGDYPVMLEAKGGRFVQKGAGTSKAQKVALRNFLRSASDAYGTVHFSLLTTSMAETYEQAGYDYDTAKSNIKTLYNTLGFNVADGFDPLSVNPATSDDYEVVQQMFLNLFDADIDSFDKIVAELTDPTTNAIAVINSKFNAKGGRASYFNTYLPIILNKVQESTGTSISQLTSSYPETKAQSAVTIPAYFLLSDGTVTDGQGITTSVQTGNTVDLTISLIAADESTKLAFNATASVNYGSLNATSLTVAAGNTVTIKYTAPSTLPTGNEAKITITGGSGTADGLLGVVKVTLYDADTKVANAVDWNGTVMPFPYAEFTAAADGTIPSGATATISAMGAGLRAEMNSTANSAATLDDTYIVRFLPPSGTKFVQSSTEYSNIDVHVTNSTFGASSGKVLSSGYFDLKTTTAISVGTQANYRVQLLRGLSSQTLVDSAVGTMYLLKDADNPRSIDPMAFTNGTYPTGNGTIYMANGTQYNLGSPAAFNGTVNTWKTTLLTGQTGPNTVAGNLYVTMSPADSGTHKYGFDSSGGSTYQTNVSVGSAYLLTTGSLQVNASNWTAKPKFENNISTVRVQYIEQVPGGNNIDFFSTPIYIRQQ